MSRKGPFIYWPPADQAGQRVDSPARLGPANWANHRALAPDPTGNDRSLEPASVRFIVCHQKVQVGRATGGTIQRIIVRPVEQVTKPKKYFRETQTSSNQIR